MKTGKYQHRGWFGFCPVYVGDAYGWCPLVLPRHRWLQPLLNLNIVIQQAAICACSFVNPDWTPVWKIRLTGRLT